MIVSPSNRVAKVKTYYFATKLAEIARLNAKGKDIINLGIGSPDLLPPSEVITLLKQEIDKPEAHKYQSYKGITELRKAFSEFYNKYFGVNLDPVDEILPLIGSKEGIMHICMSFLNEDDEVLIPNPGYPTYASATKLAGGIPRAYDLTDDNGWQPDFSALESTDLSKVKIMWVNYPHMPTGQKGNHKLYTDLVAFSKRNNILLCHDNPYSFILNDEPMSIMAVEGAKDCCLELVSLSKTYNMAGWRVGAVVGAKEYIDVVMRFKSNMDSGMFKPVQMAACAALSQKQEWYSLINAIYKRRREKVWAIMDLLDVAYDTEAVGLFVWGKPRQPKDIKAWVDNILYSASVFITPGFIFGSNGDEYIRIALCSDEKILEEAMKRISDIEHEKRAVI
ncbi:MAG: aminotransferase class I/II-fold pyridoxal phosphate-dependent enzyme [Saprospiraceae bacterium]